MLAHVLDCATELSANKIRVVTGFQGQEIRDAIESSAPNYLTSIQWFDQAEQNGTGHAVMQAMPGVDPKADCLVLYGDVPLIDIEVLKNVVQSQSTLTLLTAKPDNIEGMGRILRNERDQVVGIVEQKDATEEQKEIIEINTGILLCKGKQLADWLSKLGNNNSQGEYYLTDIVAMAVADGAAVDAVIAEDASRFAGVNSKQDLAQIERTLQKLNAKSLMAAGVTLVDPDRIDVRGIVKCDQDCSVDINVIFEGEVTIGSDVTIESNCIIRDSVIGDDCHIYANTVIENATLGSRCSVGPFARLRPNTVLENEVRIGNFVEIKKSRLDQGAKANHLSYVGDSTVGKNVNIGAGVITCNYDGANKHQTIIGDDVFVGSDSQIVAPVTIGAGATVGAGSTITRDIEAGDLAISRAKQVAYKNWKKPEKA